MEKGFELEVTLPSATREQAEALMEFLATMFDDSSVIVYPIKEEEVVDA